jgi:hypothetical protein
MTKSKEQEMKPIEWKEYEEAVRLLTALAKTDTSGGRVASQVVLTKKWAIR